MSANPAKKLFNVYEFHQMEDAGILSGRERLELIYGESLVKAHRHRQFAAVIFAK